MDGVYRIYRCHGNWSDRMDRGYGTMDRPYRTFWMDGSSGLNCEHWTHWTIWPNRCHRVDRTDGSDRSDRLYWIHWADWNYRNHWIHRTVWIYRMDRSRNDRYNG